MKPTERCKDGDKVCWANQDRSTRDTTTTSTSTNDCQWRNPWSCWEWMTNTTTRPLLLLAGVNQTLLETWIGHLSHNIQAFLQFVIPRFPTLNDHQQQQLPQAIRDVWDSIFANATATSNSDYMLWRHFDTNHDGTISSHELLNMTEFFHHIMALIRNSTGTTAIMTLSSPLPQNMSWITWFRREWPLMDWKLGVFIWRSFGGILLTLAVLSIVPGRLHGISGKILRWPVLGMTYFLITVELVYDAPQLKFANLFDLEQTYTHLASFFRPVEFTLSFACLYVWPNISSHDQSIEGCVDKWRYRNHIPNGTNMLLN